MPALSWQDRVAAQEALKTALAACPSRVRNPLVAALRPKQCHELLCERLAGYPGAHPPIRHSGHDAADPATWRRLTAAALGVEEGCDAVPLVRQWFLGMPRASGGEVEDEGDDLGSNL